MSRPRLLLVGNPDPVHVGAHFRNAAETLSMAARFCDVRAAFDASAWRRKLDWWARGHRPSRLAEFSAEVVAAAREHRADLLLAVGLAPLTAAALDQLGALGVLRINFLTDDPWNPVHEAPWFFAALARYDWVFSPRDANLARLRSVGPRAEFLPFAYAPEIHFPEPASTDAERASLGADVMLAGGADPDRVALVAGLLAAGLRVAVYGGYWDRYGTTRAAARGFLDAPGVRKATCSASTCLCIVRRANRDGHSMRSFEVPAMGGCLLAEDTPDHRRMFGPEGECALYFTGPGDAAEKIRTVLADPARGAALAAAAHRRITAGPNTYADRLQAMIDLCGGFTSEDRDRRSRALSRV